MCRSWHFFLKPPTTVRPVAGAAGISQDFWQAAAANPNLDVALAAHGMAELPTAKLPSGASYMPSQIFICYKYNFFHKYTDQTYSK